jgi:hypothetical protein
VVSHGFKTLSSNFKTLTVTNKNFLKVFSSEEPKEYELIRGYTDVMVDVQVNKAMCELKTTIRNSTLEFINEWKKMEGVKIDSHERLMESLDNLSNSFENLGDSYDNLNSLLMKDSKNYSKLFDELKQLRILLILVVVMLIYTSLVGITNTIHF